jgi:hypothetical protein
LFIWVEPIKVIESSIEFGALFPSGPVLSKLGEKKGYKLSLRILRIDFQENSNTKEKTG